MTKDEQIKEAFKALVGVSGAMTFLAEVKAVNEAESTISVNLGKDLVLDDVRLRSIVDGDNGFYLIPEVGSQVMLLRLGNSDEFLAVGFSRYSKVMIKGESISLEVNQENIIFNDNVLGSFLTDINKLVTKLNAIENGFNALKTKFNSHTHLVSTTGTAAAQTGTAAATLTPEPTTLTQTAVNDIKDPKILN
jgi:hypothetical protein